MKSKICKRYFQWMAFGLMVISVGCTTSQQPATKAESSITFIKKMITVDQSVSFKDNVIFTEEVTIMPQAYISVVPGKKITFQKRVNILGESQVFDIKSELEFGMGTISQLNPAWFGATGYDFLDDTKAFQKVLAIANKMYSSITITVPIGRFFISEELIVSDIPEDKRAINWVGGGMSNNGIKGSSISWNGKPGATLLRFQNTSRFRIENLDFTAEPNSTAKHNIAFIPEVHSVDIENCSFSGCGGNDSANIDLNINNGDQVSEIRISQCVFNGRAPSTALSQSAIKGGLANTKNFYITNCSFDAYHTAAIDIRISDIVNVEGCTFSNNEIDISCELCGLYATSNYSEHSNAFFSAGVSSNLAFATLINNNFTGSPKNGLIILDGSGSLVLLNNNFGGTDQRVDQNRVRWQEDEFSPIYSTGNFFKNTSSQSSPFINRSGQVRKNHFISKGDLGGRNSLGREKIILKE